MTNLLNGLGGTAGFGESTLGVADDASVVISLSDTFGGGGLNFLGNNYTQLAINHNGNITFGSDAYSQFNAIPLSSTGRPIIAAFFADVLARVSLPATPGGTSTGSNLLWYDQDALNQTLTITWDDIGGYRVDPLLQNAFQLQLIGTGSGNFDLTFRYETIDWSDTGGTRAGFSSGDTSGVTHEFALAGSASAALDLDTALGNTGVAGLYRFSFWTGTDAAEMHVGSSFADVMSGGDGNDTLVGGLANDTLDGGNGLDTASYASSYGPVYAILSTTGTGSSTGAAGNDILLNIENLIGSDYADSLTGSTAANDLAGGNGDDTLVGGAGDDTLTGGDGNNILNGGPDNDTVSYSGMPGGVVVYLGSGFGYGPWNFDNLVDIENIIGTEYDDVLTGNNFANRIEGLGGNDTLTGLGGSDTLDGGSGRDMADYSSAGFAVQIDLASGGLTSGGDGPDTLISIEDLQGSNFGDFLVGSFPGSLIRGLNGNDTILGSEGDDELDGGEGNDALSGGSGRDTLFGGDGDDTLSGGEDDDELNYYEDLFSGNDRVNGGSGDDRLYSAGGFDTLDGGIGNDEYVLRENAFDTLIIDSSGYDTVYSYINGYALANDIETLIFQGGMSGGSGNNQSNYLAGNQLANTMSGLGGSDAIYGYEDNDTIDGGTGSDYMYGGSGDDVYIVDDIYDQVIEDDSDGDDQSGGVDNGGGIDRVVASVDYTLGQFLNNLDLNGNQFGQTGFGNALRNIINANTVGSLMYGDEGNDTINGQNGNDTLIGGAGADVMTGNGGADQFHVGDRDQPLQLIYSTVAAPDRITDFSSAAGDRFDLGTTNGQIDRYAFIWRGDTTGSGFRATIGSAAPGSDVGADALQMWMFYDATKLLTSLYVDSDRDFVVDASDFLVTFNGDLRATLVPANMTANAFATSYPGNGVGSAGNDTMVGSAAGNSLSGLGGDDSLIGGAGTDTLDGGTGNDTLSGGTEADFLIGGSEDDSLYGGAGNDSLQGGSGNDSLFAGGAGTEGATLDSGTTVNILQGGDGADTLFGSSGADYLDGGADNDTADYRFAPAGVNVNLLTGSASGGAGPDTLISIELLIGSAFNDTLAGGLGNDTLTGGVGADILTGFAGADLFRIVQQVDITVIGGSTRYDYTDVTAVSGPDRITDFNLAGGDRLEIRTSANSADTWLWRGDAASNNFTDASSGGAIAFTAALGQAVGGRDLEQTVYTKQMWMFYDAIINKTALFMDRNFNFIVDAADFRLDFDGDMRSGLGPNAFVGAIVTSGVGTVASEIIVGTEFSDSLLGGGGHDQMHGLQGDDTLNGGTGDDTLDGGPGRDSLVGGSGNDTVIYDIADYGVDGGIGFDTLIVGDGVLMSQLHFGRNYAQVTQVLANGQYSPWIQNFEYLDFSPRTAAVNFVGEDNNDQVTGTGFNDTLDGGVGNDSLSGGLGFDNLIGGSGDDTLRGGDQGDSMSGGAGNDYLSGGKGLDTLSGGDGDDQLLGLLGSDSLTGDAGFDYLDGGDGDDFLNGGLNGDTLIGGLGNDYLGGGGGHDSISGGDGNDTIIGGLGNDTVSGGTGADIFRFAHALNASINVDTITDFTPGLDVLELSATVFTAFGGQVGQTIGVNGSTLTYNNQSGALSYDADGSGGAAATLFAIIGMSAHPTALGNDFQIVV